LILDRKIQERAILDHFRKHYPDFPKGKVIPSESPDFIIKTSPRKSIGIEFSSLPTLSHTIKNKTDLKNLLSDIRSVLSKKEEKTGLYKKKLASEYWLILTSDSLNFSNFNIHHHFERIERGNGFDKVFLFELFRGKIYYL
jgi:hypothetical protein